MSIHEMRNFEVPFGGFYESLYQNEMEIAHERILGDYRDDPDLLEPMLPMFSGVPSDKIPWSDLEKALDLATSWGWAQRHMAASYTAAFAEWLADSLGVKADGFPVHFVELHSPKFYNFDNDHIFAKMPLGIFQVIFNRINSDPDCRAIFDQTVIDRHSSRSGFASFYDNDPENWRSKPLEDWDHNELCTLMVAWIRINEPDCQDGVSFDSFIFDSVFLNASEVAYDAVERAIAWSDFKADAIKIADAACVAR